MGRKSERVFNLHPSFGIEFHLCASLYIKLLFMFFVIYGQAAWRFALSFKLSQASVNSLFNNRSLILDID